MDCPGCGSAITSLVRKCSTCGFDFGKELYDKFSFYYTWKDELGKLTELQNSLFAAVANVKEKIQRYEAVLKRDLEMRAASPAPAKRRTTPAKNKRR